MNLLGFGCLIRCFQRRSRDIHRQLLNLRATRDSVQTEANDNVLTETSGLDDALKVCLLRSATLNAPVSLTFSFRKWWLRKSLP